MAKNDLELSKEAFLKLLSKYLDNAQEERDLALDRYRRQDDQMQTPEDFILQGKNAATFLTLAANRTEALLKVSEKYEHILFKKDEKTEAASTISDDFRKQINQQLRDIDNGDSSMDLD